ncbi:MAG: hypothetical protein OEY55_07715 [Acidimicrobiia bacterium]|nr:hypothetical protein [Acidimicrobiia bacterium]MDH5504564.1 hypothetical protein [Acidimicrobiia bacterium]
MNPLIVIYVLYGMAAVGLTVWLAKTLFSNGAVFLEGVFKDNHELAEALNRLLVTGFYMLNLGYAFLIFKTNGRPVGAVESIELLVNKMGVLLVSLGLIHFLNMIVFWRLRKGSDRRTPPALPTPQGDFPW